MEKEEYARLCRKLSAKGSHELTKEILPVVIRHLALSNKKKLPVIWIETNDSGDNNIPFMDTTYPYLGQVLTDMIDLLYSNTFMAAQGSDALQILNQAALS